MHRGSTGLVLEVRVGEGLSEPGSKVIHCPANSKRLQETMGAKGLNRELLAAAMGEELQYHRAAKDFEDHLGQPWAQMLLPREGVDLNAEGAYKASCPQLIAGGRQDQKRERAHGQRRTKGPGREGRCHPGKRAGEKAGV